MTTKLNIQSLAATANRPANLRGCVNDCKSIVYKTSNSLKTKTKRPKTLLLLLLLMGLTATPKAFAQTQVATINYNNAGVYYTLWSDNTASVEYSYTHHFLGGTLNLYDTIPYNGVKYPLKRIGNQAFVGANNLSALSIPATVTSIGEAAFSECGFGGTLEIPDNVLTIEESAFFRNRFTTVVIGDGVTSIGGQAFYSTYINVVTLGANLATIGDRAFAYNNNAGESKDLAVTCRSLVPPALGTDVFKQQNLTTNVPCFVADAYEQAGGWGTIVAQDVKYGRQIDGVYYVLDRCNQTASVTNLYYWTFSNILYYSSQDATNSYTGDVVIPAEVVYEGIDYAVTLIHCAAFAGSADMTSVTIGSNVTEIRPHAFRDCSGLASIICQSITPPTLGQWCFTDVPVASVSLQVPCGTMDAYEASVGSTYFNTPVPGWNDFPDKQELLPVWEQDGLFYELDCNTSTATVIYDPSYATLEWAVVPYSITHGESTYYVTGIGDKAFEGCTALERVSLHDEITTIGSEAFKNCSSIVQISTQAAMPPVAGQDAFLGVPENASIVGMPFCYQYDYSVAPEWNRFSNFSGSGPCDYNFTGMVSTSWSDPQNWMGAEVPDGNSRVAVRGTCEIDDDVTVGSITLDCYINEEYGLYDRLIVKSGKTLTVNNFIWTTGDATHFIIEDRAQVVQPNAGAKATVEKNITAYTPNTKDGYHLIGHSFADNGAVSEMDNLLANDYDLYYYDEPTHYWMNQKQTANNFTELEAAKGYLYANSESQTIGLKGSLNAANAMVTIPLSYEADALKGFNLVGNPFAHNVTTFAGTNVATEVYRMNGTKDNVVVSEISETDPLKPGEGFFVKATGDWASITFNAQTRGEAKALELVERPTLTIDLTQDGLLVDSFILKRDGEPLEKISLNGNGTRIYATHGGKDYAVATIVGVGRDGVHTVSTEVPVNFKAAKNGTYTLTFDTQHLDLEYLHLIDNLTGEDIDLLSSVGASTGSAAYTFEAKTTDYASRFRLVFSADGDICEPGKDAREPNFAY